MGGNKSKADTPQQNNDDTKIHRLHIGQTAGIGSLYDARRDCFLDKPQLEISEESRPSEELLQYAKSDLHDCQDQDPFDSLNIDRDLCLSVKLDMVPEGQLSSLFKYQWIPNAMTRILYYYCVSDEKYVPNEQRNFKKSDLAKILKDTNATHFVTQVKRGIILVVVIELPSQDESHLNPIINKIKQRWEVNTVTLSQRERRLLDRITSIKVFSNIPELCELTKLADISEKLIQIMPNVSEHRLLQYTFQPIRFLPNIAFENYNYFPLNSDVVNKIEQHLIQLSRLVESVNSSLISENKNLFEDRFKDQFHQIQQQISNEEKEHQSRMEEICRTVQKMRGGVSQEEMLTKLNIDAYVISFQKKLDSINNSLKGLQEKLQLIDGWKDKRISYWNVKQIVKENDNDLKRIIEQLMEKGNGRRIFCFDDNLEKSSSTGWKDFYQQLIDMQGNQPEQEFVYADFSFCLCRLTNFKVLPSKDMSKQQKMEEQSSEVTTPFPRSEAPASESSSPISEHTPPPPKPTVSPSHSASPTSGATLAPTQSTQPLSEVVHRGKPNMNSINVLLLGESGVGKSTFINAIVNYLNFNTLEEARSRRPVVLTPVSFLITEGDNFKERIIIFGEQDSNEKHNNSGQSVTQQCRSYVFAIGTQTKLRLIDTPGMGDTRGLDQDDLNMQHILSFISNLSHLNAICILLKPNESRLNVVFRSYFTRLIGFLGEHIRNNIIFCFTNARATFFTPGNTGPLLRKMLESQSIKDIPFDKTNTFCFDSESFRYLIALLNKVEFDDYQKEEYERSWIASATESNRLFDYICTKLKSCSQDKWQSIEHAQFQIIRLARPISETIRNTMRNKITVERNSSKSLIKLCANSVPSNSRVCLECRKPKFLSEFWVLPDKLHVLSVPCDKSTCGISRHSNLNYQINYESVTNTKKPSLDELKTMVAEFIYFLKCIVCISRENDPILSALDEIIDEEKYICSRKGSDILNSHLCDKLEGMRKTCEKLWTTSAPTRSSVALSDVYQQISSASENETIKEQLTAIKATQETYMSEQEKYLS